MTDPCVELKWYGFPELKNFKHLAVFTDVA
jgi:hypothetical protein